MVVAAAPNDAAPTTKSYGFTFSSVISLVGT